MNKTGSIVNRLRLPPHELAALLAKQFMQAQLATQVEPASLSDRDKAALVRLLSDPDPEVFEPVRQTLMT